MQNNLLRLRSILGQLWVPGRTAAGHPAVALGSMGTFASSPNPATDVRRERCRNRIKSRSLLKRHGAIRIKTVTSQQINATYNSIGRIRIGAEHPQDSDRVPAPPPPHIRSRRPCATRSSRCLFFSLTERHQQPATPAMHENCRRATTPRVAQHCHSRPGPPATLLLRSTPERRRSSVRCSSSAKAATCTCPRIRPSVRCHTGRISITFLNCAKGLHPPKPDGQ